MKKLVLLSIVLGLAFVFTGCAKAKCGAIAEECDLGSADEDQCVEDYKDGDGDCKSAIRDFADCVEDNGCDEDCSAEAVKVADAC